MKLSAIFTARYVVNLKFHSYCVSLNVFHTFLSKTWLFVDKHSYLSVIFSLFLIKKKEYKAAAWKRNPNKYLSFNYSQPWPTVRNWKEKENRTWFIIRLQMLLTFSPFLKPFWIACSHSITSSRRVHIKCWYKILKFWRNDVTLSEYESNDKI